MKLNEHRQAIALRQEGRSVKEIATLLGVSKSSVSGWVRKVELDPIAKLRIIKIVGLGRLRSAEVKRARVEMFEDGCLEQGMKLVALSKV